MKGVKAEIKKTKGRFLQLIFPAGLLVQFLWLGAVTAGMGADRLEQGYYSLVFNISMMNSMILPVLLAVFASRVCDIENKGNTYKLLCTMEEKGAIFRSKLIFEGVSVGGFALAQTGLVILMGKLLGVSQAVPWRLLAWFCLVTFLTSLAVMLLQQILSLMLDNQLYPLFIAILGTFYGIFCWLFPMSFLQRLLPWGYYCVGNCLSFQYYEETEVMEYYIHPIPYIQFAVLILGGVLLYAAGKRLFLNKEV